MKFLVSRHAEEEMRGARFHASGWSQCLRIRGSAFRSPEARRFSSRVWNPGMGKCTGFRAVVATKKEPPVVVTVYQTSKIEKYWRPG